MQDQGREEQNKPQKTETELQDLKPKDTQPKVDEKQEENLAQETGEQKKGILGRMKDAIFGKEGETKEEKKERQEKVGKGVKYAAEAIVVGVLFFVNPLVGLAALGIIGGVEYNNHKNEQKAKEENKGEASSKEPKKGEGKEKELEKEKETEKGKETEKDKEGKGEKEQGKEGKGLMGFIKNHKLACGVATAVLLFSGAGLIGAALALVGMLVAEKVATTAHEKIQENGGYMKTAGDAFQKIKGVFKGKEEEKEQGQDIKKEGTEIDTKSQGKPQEIEMTTFKDHSKETQQEGPDKKPVIEKLDDVFKQTKEELQGKGGDIGIELAVRTATQPLGKTGEKLADNILEKSGIQPEKSTLDKKLGSIELEMSSIKRDLNQALQENDPKLREESQNKSLDLQEKGQKTK